MPSRWKDSEHLLRLAALFAVGTALFLAAQAVLVPADFGELGHYRTGALAANRGRAIAFAGEKACVECHTETGEEKAGNQHRGVRCEACHGPQARHAAGEGDPPRRPNVATLCASCHTFNPARPRAFPQVRPADHAGGEACTTCHTPHAPRIG